MVVNLNELQKAAFPTSSVFVFPRDLREMLADTPVALFGSVYLSSELHEYKRNEELRSLVATIA